MLLWRIVTDDVKVLLSRVFIENRICMKIVLNRAIWCGKHEGCCYLRKNMESEVEMTAVKTKPWRGRQISIYYVWKWRTWKWDEKWKYHWFNAVGINLRWLYVRWQIPLIVEAGWYENHLENVTVGIWTFYTLKYTLTLCERTLRGCESWRDCVTQTSGT